MRIRISPWQVLGLATVLLFWILMSRWIGEARVPSVTSVASAIKDSVTYSTLLASRFSREPNIIGDIIYTVSWAIAGMLTGSVAGILWGLVMGYSDFARRLTSLPIEILRILPSLVALPFFLMWFGPSSVTQFFVVSVYAYVRIVIITLEALRNVSPMLHQYAATMGGTRAQIFRTIVLPAIAPEVLGGLRVALAQSWGLQIVAELIGSPAGVGKVLGYLLTNLRVDFMIATIFWLTLVAVAVDRFVFVPLSARLTRWVPRSVD